jgi:hypothetical protein
MIRKWIVLSVPFVALLAGGFAYGYRTVAGPHAEMGEVAAYVCPATGEELPCPNCCPLNQ